MKRASMLAAFALIVPLLSAHAPVPPATDFFIEGPRTLTPGTAAVYRILAFRTAGMLQTHPVEAGVRIRLGRDGEERLLYDGPSGACRFIVPDWAPGDATLTIAVEGCEPLVQPVRIARDLRILLTTDKPLYQPGQTIHIRALALHDGTLQPAANREVLFEVEDARGNKVFKQRANTNAFGVAAVDFLLASEVNEGDYRVRAVAGETETDKTVGVRRYVLPKFNIEIETDRPFYEPGQTLRGTLTSRYFFGKPVAGANVEIVASTFDAEFHEFARVRTRTNEDGAAPFEIELPRFFAGQPITHGQGLVRLEAAVTDTADHSERKTITRTVAAEALTVGAIPEGGRVAPGLENRIFIVTAGPNGSPAPARVEFTIGENRHEVETGENGWGTLSVQIPPGSLRQTGDGRLVVDAQIRARARDGREVVKNVALDSQPRGDQVRLRLDRAIYTAGQEMQITAMSTLARGTLFVDVIRSGQTLLTTMGDIRDGRARLSLAIPPEVFGGVEVRGYIVQPEGTILRDRRVVYIHPPSDLEIRVSADREVYRPGETARISLYVVDREGRGVQAALGILVVDEAVYALQEMQPGLEKAFFTLEQQLRQPKVEVHFHGGDVSGLIQRRAEDADGAAEILFSAVALPEEDRGRITANTLPARYEQARGQAWTLATAALEWVAAGNALAERPGEIREDIFVRAGVAEELRRTPWGTDWTPEDVKRFVPWFTPTDIEQTILARHAVRIAPALVRTCAAVDPVEWREDAWRYRADSLRAAIEAAYGGRTEVTDAYGRPITYEALARHHPWFSAENLARVARLQRAMQIQVAIKQRAQEDEVVRVRDGRAEFLPRLLDSLSLPETVRSNLRGRWTMEELQAEYPPAFDPQRYVGWTRFVRLRAVFDALVEHPEVLRAEDPIGRLIETGALSQRKATALDGRRWRLEDYPALAPRNIMAALLARRATQIAGLVCEHIHRQGRALPDDPVRPLIEAGLLEEAAATDPWGRRLRILDAPGGRQIGMSCGLLSRKALVSAGPDGEFGTEDDVTHGDAVEVVAAPDEQIPEPSDLRIVEPPATMEKFDEDREALLEDAGGRNERRGFERARALRELAGAGQPAPNAPAQEPVPVPTRIREHFPETLFWAPNVITGADGRTTIEIALADSITTWRMTVSGNSAGGLLGSTSGAIRVFQEFFADIDFPVALTQNDIVRVPVAVYNYLDRAQTVRVEAEPADWFELMDERVKELTLGPQEVRAVYFRVRARRIGRHALTVRATGEIADALRRSVEVLPDGKPVERAWNGALAGTIRHTVEVPANAIAETPRLYFKVYPGVMAQVVEGLESLLRLPGG